MIVKVRYNLVYYFGHKILLIMALFMFFLLMGIIGFMILEDYTFTEATYMTVITISTVGYRELHPPSLQTMWFTVFLILSGVGVLTYSASVIAQEFLDGKFIDRYKRNKVENIIESLQNHVIICGLGRNGTQAARMLQNHGIDFVILEQNTDLELPMDLRKSIIVTGDGTNDDDLRKAGVLKAKALITTLSDDSQNLFVVLSARQINPSLFLISRASKVSTVSKLTTAGANEVVMPDKAGGEIMAGIIVSPELTEFLDHVSLEGAHNVSMLEVKCADLPKELIGKRLSDLNIRIKTDCTLIAAKDENDNYMVNPELNQILNPKWSLILMGRPEQIKKLKQVYSIPG